MRTLPIACWQAEPANIVLVLLLVMLIGACVGLINGFVMAKFKVHPYIITLAMQMIVYGIYLTVSNSVQVGSFDSSYTTSFVTKPLFQIQTGVRPNALPSSPWFPCMCCWR